MRSEKEREYQKAWCKKNVSKRREYSWNWQGIPITAEGYDKLLAVQKGSCAICTVHQSILAKPLHVDHDHKTGEIRGLLCQKCNRGLGHFDDNTALLTTAISYLQGGHDEK